MEIRVYELVNNGFIPKEIVYTASEVVYKEYMYNSGHFIIKMSLDDPKSKSMIKNRLVIIENEFAGIIEDIYKNSADSTNEVTIIGIDLKGILRRRITMQAPPSPASEVVSYDPDKITGSTETCIKYYWHSNIGAKAHLKRQIPYVTIGENKNRGIEKDEYTAELENLGDVTNKLATNADLIVTAKIDKTELNNDNLVFLLDVREPKDRTAVRETDTDSEKEPFILSFDRNTALTMDYSDEMSGSSNTFYSVYNYNVVQIVEMIDEKGEIKREVRVYPYKKMLLYIPESMEEETGVNRMEYALNVKLPHNSFSYDDEPHERAESSAKKEAGRAVVDYEPKTKMIADVNYTNAAKETEYDLGDYITIQNREWGIEKDVQITEIEVKAVAGERTVIVTVGDIGISSTANVQRNIVPLIKRDLINQINGKSEPRVD